MISPYDGVLEQWGRYTNYVTSAGFGVTESDMEEFLVKFLGQRKMFQMGTKAFDNNTPPLKGADWTHPSTGDPLFRRDVNLTTKQQMEVLRPILRDAYTEAHGGFSLTLGFFPTAPDLSDTPEAKKQHELIKTFVGEYNRVFLPFCLRKTMHHPIQTVEYSRSRGDGVTTSQMYRIKSEADIQRFMSAAKFETFAETTGSEITVSGGTNRAIRGIQFRPSPEGYPKMAVLDFDNVSGAAFEDYLEHIHTIAKHVSKKHDILIQFTGRSFQIWLNVNGFGFETMQAMKEYCKNNLLRGVKKHWTYDREQGMVEMLPVLDDRLFGQNQTTGMFFGMHFKMNDLEGSTGLCRIPVSISDLKNFNPMSAHPMNVIERFEHLQGVVDRWFVSAGIGAGFSDTRAAPPCVTVKDKGHEFVSFLEKWKKRFKEKTFRDLGPVLEDAKKVAVMTKYDGQLGMLSFNKRGGFRINGERLDSGINLQRTIMLQGKGGHFGWDNHLTRDFEEMCARLGFDELTVLGESILLDDVGVPLGPSAVGFLRKDNPSPEDFSKLKFVITDVYSVDGVKVQDLSFDERIAKVADLDGDRIRCVDPLILMDDHYPVIKAKWESEVKTRGHEGLVLIVDGKTYKVKRKYTLDAVIMGIGTTSKTFEDEKEEIGTVMIGVAKKMKFGNVYVPVGYVGPGRLTKEESAALFRQVIGPMRSTEYADGEHVIRSPKLREQYPDILLVEPKVVVEVQFMRLSDVEKVRGPSFYFKQDRAAPGSTAYQRGGSQYSVTPRLYTTRGLGGTPTLLRVREDKDPLNSTDIRHTQMSEAGGFNIKAAPKGKRTGVEAIPNPESRRFKYPRQKACRHFVSKSGLTRVRMNPFYGWNNGPRWIGGFPREYSHPDYPGMTYGVEPGTESETRVVGTPTPWMGSGYDQRAGRVRGRGGQPVDVNKDLKGEFENQLVLTPEKWGLHYAPDAFMRFPKDKHGISYYLSIPGFIVGSEDGVFDEEGPNIGGVVHEKGAREETLYHNQLLMDYMEDDDQARRDAEFALSVNMDPRLGYRVHRPAETRGDFGWAEENLDTGEFVRQDESMKNDFRDRSFDASKDREIHSRALRLAKKNPGGEFISDAALPDTEAVSPLARFMRSDDDAESETGA